MPSFVFQIPPSEVKVKVEDVKVIPQSAAEEVGVDSQQEKQVLCDSLCVTVQELCDCPKYTPVTLLTLCDCPSDSLHQCFLLYFSHTFPWIVMRAYRHRMPRSYRHRMSRSYRHRMSRSYRHRMSRSYRHRMSRSYRHRMSRSYRHRMSRYFVVCFVLLSKSCVIVQNILL